MRERESGRVAIGRREGGKEVERAQHGLNYVSLLNSWYLWKKRVKDSHVFNVVVRAQCGMQF